MAQYRNRQQRRSIWMRLGVLGLAAGAVWWWWPQGAEAPRPDALAMLTSNRPDAQPAPPTGDSVPERGASDSDSAAGVVSVSARAAALLKAGRQAMASQDLLAARTQLNEAYRLGVEPSQVVDLRADLVRLAGETILSARIVPDDPYVERYVIQAGDTLGKIANRCEVSPELLAGINNISNPNLIRLGQTVKLVKGPFRAVVRKADFVLEVYLDEVLVRHFPVGLGVDGSTPTGQWLVSVKLENPTYYPPRGGRILPADDPENPLGERWIGLEGVAGEAMNQQRYGIHGTIEPDSIGHNASLGCIRLYNEDVEQLFDLLVVKHSTVVVQ